MKFFSRESEIFFSTNGMRNFRRKQNFPILLETFLTIQVSCFWGAHVFKQTGKLNVDI